MKLRYASIASLAAFAAACAGTLENRDQFLDGGDGGTPSACPDVPQTVFTPTCGTAGCHAAIHPQSGLDLASPNVASRLVGVVATSGGLLVDPAHPEQSLVYRKLEVGAPGSRMPIGRVLDDATIACVLSWVESVSGGDAGVSNDAAVVPVDDGATLDASSSDGGPTADAGVVTRIAAGRLTPYTDHDGNVWSADTGFTGGQTVANDPPLPIDKTPDGPLYNGERYGSFGYAFSVPNGAYTVTLKFAETYAQITATGQRQFNVSINGEQVLTNFDIFAEAGGRSVAVDRPFAVDVKTGGVEIRFAPGAIQSPKVDAIAIVPK